MASIERSLSLDYGGREVESGHIVADADAKSLLKGVTISR